jgi:hypothetical protein
MGMCEFVNRDQGFDAGDPTDGDCKRDSCDGNGNVVVVNDDGDIPPGDGNPCTTSICNNGVPMPNVNNPVGDPCPTGVCNSMAMCIECIADNDCPNATDTCFNDTCVSCTDGVQNGDETDVDCGGTSCKKCQGDACMDGMECDSAFCADGVCCDTSCTGTCKSCGIDATKGTCTNIPLGMTDDAPLCGGTDVCNGSGVCKLMNGQDCNANNDCASNNCAGMPKKCAP